MLKYFLYLERSLVNLNPMFCGDNLGWCGYNFYWGMTMSFKGKIKRGMVLYTVMGIITVLMIVGAFLLKFFRNEMSQAIAVSDYVIATNIAEAGVEHAIHMLKYYVNDVDDKVKLGWSKLFSKDDEFEVEIPMADPGLGGDDKGLDNAISSSFGSKAKLVKVLFAFKTTEKINSYTKKGILTVRATAKYGRVKRTVEEEFEVLCYLDVPIQWDKVLYVANSGQEILGYKEEGGKKIHQNLAIFGNVYFKDALIDLNTDPSIGAMIGDMFTGAAAQKVWYDMIQYLAENGELKGTGGWVDDWFGGVMGYSGLYERGEGASLFSAGARGANDLTGVVVMKNAWVKDWVKDADKFSYLKVKSVPWDVSYARTKLKIYGHPRRGYAKKVGGKIVEVTNEVYCSWVDTSIDYPENTVEGLMSPEAYRRAARVYKVATQDITFYTQHWTGWGKTSVTYHNVVYYCGWGKWQDVASYSLLGWFKRLFKKPTRYDDSLMNPYNPRKVIQLSGIHYIDGNVLIEGFYRGSGTIVAAGDIYIGGKLLKHPVDKDGLDPKNTNKLQLIALGIKPGSKGKIILQLHPDISWKDWSVVDTLLGRYMYPDNVIEIDAYMFAPNGFEVEPFYKWWFGKVMPDKERSGVVIKGNLVCYNWDRQKAYDNIVIIEDRDVKEHSKKVMRDQIYNIDFDPLSSLISYRIKR